MKTERDRERLVEQLLPRALHSRAGATGPGVCLDAETLAAWADGGLTDASLAVATMHVSQCGQCQAMLAAVAKTSASSVAEARPWWLRARNLGWLVPLSAGAAAVALWIAVPRRQEPVPVDRQERRLQETESVRAAEPQAAAERPQVSLEGGEADRVGAVKRDGAKKESTAVAPAEARAAREDTEQGGRVSSGDLKVAAPPAPAAASKAAEPSTVGEDRAVRSSRLNAAVAKEIQSPDRSIRWRIGVAGVVQYSTDGGSTWEALATVAADLTAGSSPSPSVCWLVGRSATVLLTTDGRRFQRVAFPEEVDLVSVRATGVRTAEVTAADGRTFMTADGGATWNQVAR